MAAAPDTAAAKGGFRAWLNKRLPVDEFVESQLTGYFAPKNFNFWYFFGALSLMVFVIQILSGIFLTMHYKPSEAEAFNSVAVNSGLTDKKQPSRFLDLKYNFGFDDVIN